ncbi:hypothetical protein MRB53_017502 [Persea americana]|uniref:Uncharacterized protein n=1 Tax=Persea americana TaxID=3435 RepID=A0ACC2M5B5_PERAE|nr:hypothetical protein MRB53_017502 [Persea americana]|eukprot:TRINITY_DN33021_c0_g1_i11.p1 TRINITY_DN33021_c0_g1~~TRINITY_DN33021_c0_g1_i11.p1  ORF type:complete len:151 (+),score=16.42 TRINITY_DN33021_c0_g1_i11:210-662(+)
MERNRVEKAKKWQEDRANAAYATRVDNLALAGLQIVGAQAGRILCNFLVPKHLADKDGNWRAGAIATLIDNVGSVAIASTTGWIKISVDFDISYFSTAKINEEVDIEATTSAHVGQLSYVTVEIRKKGSREMVAVGKQWMASTGRVLSKL